MKNLIITSVSAMSIALVAASTATAQLSANPNANPPAPARPPATTQQNPGAPPEIIAPPSAGTGAGVVRPRTNVDPGMQVRPPAGENFATPVIPPPGTAGSNQPNVVPK